MQDMCQGSSGFNQNRGEVKARNQDLKIVKQNEELVCVSPKGGGAWGGGAVPPSLIPKFFEILVLISCILEAFRCRMFEIVTFL